MRVFSWKGSEVVVKDCSYRNDLHYDGIDYNEYNSAYDHYREALKAGKINPSRYVLVRLRSFGSFSARQAYDLKLGSDEPLNSEGKKQFLVMEKLNEGGVKGDMFSEEPGLRLHALRQLHRDMEVAGIYSLNPRIDPMILGNTNPREPSKGKWVFALPQDR